ncbi:MAG TPA: VOC family protein [Caulobacteraceae bacterium]|jgi:catechol 2,3-dioxygenase-like lactoylglutathione lyase family enzyme|nr:VOC family protein [Caulobacteraceae bacterium]
MMLRSVELVLPGAAEAAAFMTDVWGLALAEARDGAYYLRGSGSFPYIFSLEEGPERFVRTNTFTCTSVELAALERRVAANGLKAAPTTAREPGGGTGFVVEMPDGELFRFLVGAGEVAPIKGRDLPLKLSHVVLNSTDAEATADAVERALGFKVSDRTRGMVFVSCNPSHHSLAFARAGYGSFNHIAFEMEDMDAVMRGIGRLRDHGMVPVWGPGRHGPGANVFAYFVAPFGAVVEFSTAVDEVTEDYKPGAPEDWTWPANRIDEWGMSDRDEHALSVAEKAFRFRREWTPQPLPNAAATPR